MSLNNLRNKMKRYYIETRYIFRKKFQQRRNSLLHWGHEKMTVMFIPHNEKKIFNFQISKFTGVALNTVSLARIALHVNISSLFTD